MRPRERLETPIFSHPTKGMCVPDTNGILRPLDKSK